MDQTVLRWFGHVLRMDKLLLPIASRVLMAAVNAGHIWIKPSLGWMDEWCESGLGAAEGCRWRLCKGLDEVDSPDVYIGD